mgnify:CR=1 FL=1
MPITTQKKLNLIFKNTLSLSLHSKQSYCYTHAITIRIHQDGKT